MTRKPLLSFAFVFGLAALAFAVPPGFVVKADKDNVVARYLVGSWKLDAALSKALTGREREKVSKVSFTSDAAVAAKIPAKFDKYLASKRIYLAGNMVLTLKGKEVTFPYILITHGGSPLVVFFEDRAGKPLDDAETLYVSVAGAKDPTKAMLFVGGDHADEPFLAFRRAK